MLNKFPQGVMIIMETYITCEVCGKPIRRLKMNTYNEICDEIQENGYYQFKLDIESINRDLDNPEMKFLLRRECFKESIWVTHDEIRKLLSEGKLCGGKIFWDKDKPVPKTIPDCGCTNTNNDFNFRVYYSIDYV